MFHDFGTHPVRRADLRLVAGVGIHAFSGHSEVCQFGHAVLIEEDVGSLDVSVYLLVLMQVDESLEN